MYNTKFIMVEGNEIYPGYLDKDMRKELLNKYGSMRSYMWCGCKSKERLYYRISEDLRIYPEHNNYVHDVDCCRYCDDAGNKKRKTAYLVDDQNGDVTVYLTFNPKNISPEPSNDDTIQDNDVENEDDIENEDDVHEELIIEKESSKKKETSKEPKLSFNDLVRSINVDTYTDRVLKGKDVVSKETLSKYVYCRMNKVKVSRMKKSIGELSLEEDGVRFLYTPFSQIINKEQNGLRKCYIATRGVDGKVHNNLIFPDTLEKVLKDYYKRYYCEPDQNTMLAALQYLKKTKNGNQYRVLGRVHLFQVSDSGIYCKTQLERATYNMFADIMCRNDRIAFWIPPDNEKVGAIIRVANKEKHILLIFRTPKTEIITFDHSRYEPYVVSEQTPFIEEEFYDFVSKLNDRLEVSI